METSETTRKKKGIHYAWFILATGFLLYFTVQALTMQVMGLFTKPISAEFGVDRSTFLLHNVALNLGGLIAAPIWAKLFKKYNFQALMAIGITMTALGFFFNAISTNIYVLIAAGFFRGIFFIGTTMLPVAMLIAAWFDEKRGLASSMITVAAGFGGMVFNPVVQRMISTYGWRTAEMFIAGLVLIMAPITLLFIRANPAKKGLMPFGYKGDKTGEKKEEAPLAGMMLKQARRTPQFFLLLFAAFSTTFVAGAVIQISPYLTDIGYTAEFAAGIVSLLALISIFGRPLMGLIYDKFKGTTSAAIFFISAAVGFVFLSNAGNTFCLYAAVVLWAFNSAISLIMPPLWTIAMFGKKDYAAIVSWTVVVGRFGSMTGGYLIGFLYDMTGNNNLIWPVCSTLMILSLLGVVYSLKKTSKLQLALA